MGLIRKKHTKEAIIFDIAMDGKKYASSELSSDVYRARSDVIKLLINIFGEVRDCNGTLVAKQVDSLSRIKELFKTENLPNHFLFEPFFFSLTPTHMQTIIPPAALKGFFEFFHSIVRSNSTDPIPMVRSEKKNSHFMIIVASPRQTVRDFILPTIEKMKLKGDLVSASHDLATFQILSFMVHLDGKSEKTLESEVRKAFREWRQYEKIAKENRLMETPETCETAK